MTFNPCKTIDFSPQFVLDDQPIMAVKEKRLLGLTIRSDLKWSSHISYMLGRAYKRLWILRRLKFLGAPQDALLQVYIKQIRSILEYAVPAWQGSVSAAEKLDVERVQKCAIRIILGFKYSSYTSALELLSLETLDKRRDKLCLNFALKTEKNNKFSHWFKPYRKARNTRYKAPKYEKPRSRH